MAPATAGGGLTRRTFRRRGAAALELAQASVNVGDEVALTRFERLDLVRLHLHLAAQLAQLRLRLFKLQKHVSQCFAARGVRRNGGFLRGAS